MATECASLDCSDKISAYLRVASLAVASYDWLWTLPIELEIYGEQVSLFNLKRGCVLFILIRYVSIVALLANDVGFFTTNMRLSVCARYIYFAPVMKCIQMSIAHTILFVRTWAIARRSSWVFWFLVTLGAAMFGLELWSSIYKRVPAQNAAGNCTSGNEPGTKVDWAFYVASAVFDAACMGIATVTLWAQSYDRSGIQGLARILFKEGLLFFGVLQAVNILNMVIFISATSVASQSAATSLGFTLTWIMAQRILIQLHELRNGSTGGHTLSSSRSRSAAAGGTTGALHTLRFGRKSTRTQGDVELDGVHVAVRVEEHRERGPGGKWDPDEGSSVREPAEEGEASDKEDVEALERTQNPSAHVVLQL